MPESSEGPVLSRKRLSVALRRSRDEAGFTQEQVAKAMDWSLSKLIRIEGGTVGISTSDLRILLQHYHVDDAEVVQHLIELARGSRARPWWVPFRESLPSPTFESLLGLEAAAARIDVYNASIIPGLLQTEEYIHSVLNGFPRTVLPADAVDIRADIRLRRQQQILTRRTELSVVIDEAALRRSVGDPEVMRRQLHHLLEQAERPEITLVVIPFSIGPYVPTGPFSILSFDDSEADTVYIELFDTDTLLESPQEVMLYRRLFQWMHGKALAPSESADLIKQVADEFGAS